MRKNGEQINERTPRLSHEEASLMISDLVKLLMYNKKKENNDAYATISSEEIDWIGQD